jgi:hypothetical protein
MAYYAFIDENKIVVEVIAGQDETATTDGVYWEIYYGIRRGLPCLRTSYHGNIRKQFAGIGYSYNETADVFVSIQPYPSWILDENYDWIAPVPYPQDGHVYVWDEATQTWLLAN